MLRKIREVSQIIMLCYLHHTVTKVIFIQQTFPNSTIMPIMAFTQFAQCVDCKVMHRVYCQIIFVVCDSFLTPLLGCTFFSSSLCLYLAIYYRFAAFFLSALPNSSKADIPKGVLQGRVLGHVTVTCMVTLEGGA